MPPQAPPVRRDLPTDPCTTIALHPHTPEHLRRVTEWLLYGANIGDPAAYCSAVLGFRSAAGSATNVVLRRTTSASSTRNQEKEADLMADELLIPSPRPRAERRAPDSKVIR
ncbi:MAG: hypothetical protein HOZ81_30575 [Streptomyces sp.]|nr:hypothetical protein [Streptomyces sp.]